MNKMRDLLSKTLVVGVIVLFIGVGVQPAFALNESTSISDDEDDCDICPAVSELMNIENDERYEDISIPITEIQGLKLTPIDCDELWNLRVKLIDRWERLESEGRFVLALITSIFALIVHLYWWGSCYEHK